MVTWPLDSASGRCAVDGVARDPEKADGLLGPARRFRLELTLTVSPSFSHLFFKPSRWKKGISVVGRMDKRDKAHDWILVHVVFSALGAQSRTLLAGYVSL